MILTLTMNPAIDISAEVDEVAPIRKLRCANVVREAGGGGINVARVLRRFGAEVVAVYPVGGPVGQLLRDLVDHESIPSITIPIAQETREDFTVLETASGEQYRFVMPGPTLTETEWGSCLDTLGSLIERGGYVIGSGSLPPGVPEDFYIRLIRSARTSEAKVVLDASGAPLKAALSEGVYLVKPNLREMRDLIGGPLGDEAALVEACRKLIASGGTEMVALTLGDRGAVLVTAERALRAEAPYVEPVSAVGAGDSFLGALIWRMAAGHDLEDAFRYGVAGGTAALLSPGTELCHVADVERLLPQVVVRAL